MHDVASNSARTQVSVRLQTWIGLFLWGSKNQKTAQFFYKELQKQQQKICNLLLIQKCNLLENEQLSDKF